MARKANIQKENMKNNEFIPEEMEENTLNTEKKEEKMSSNIAEHSEKVRKLVEQLKDFISEFERGWSIKRIEPIKEEIKRMLDENKEKENLSKSDKSFLYYLNRVIYGKVEQNSWRRQEEKKDEKEEEKEEEKKENKRPENAPAQFNFKSLKQKVEWLKRAVEGYGNKCIITSIEDIKENTFYCIKETEIDGKMEFECAIKFEKNEGIANIDAMTEKQAFTIRDSYFNIKDNPEEQANISYHVREIYNNPKHADNYFIKIATEKEKEVEYVNTATEEQEMAE